MESSNSNYKDERLHSDAKLARKTKRTPSAARWHFALLWEEHQTFKLKSLIIWITLRKHRFMEFLPQKGNATDLLNQGWQQDFEYFTQCESSDSRRELLEILDTLEASISSVMMQSQDIQINPVQAMDDSLIVSKSSLIESENHNAFNKSKIETQMQRQEEKVNMREAVDAGLVVTRKAVGQSPT
ncbi:hypothetical protein Tco_0121810 [Tanacetum coccineum]